VEQLQLFRYAEVLFALGDPTADLAEELSPLHQVFIHFRKLLDIADILKIAEVIFMIGMGHLVFFHLRFFSCPIVADNPGKVQGWVRRTAGKAISGAESGRTALVCMVDYDEEIV